MCGIIAVLRRPSGRGAPDAAELSASLARAAERIDRVRRSTDLAVAELDAAAGELEQVDALLHGVPGVLALLGDRALLLATEERLADVTAAVEAIEHRLDTATGIATGDLESLHAVLIRVKDAAWAIARDRLRTAVAVADLAGPDARRAAIETFVSVQIALSAIDRLEVRGRDSAGLHLLVRDHGLDLDDPTVRRLLDERGADAQFRSRSVRTPQGCLGFVYKAAAEIGELGDNTATLRAALRDDPLLHLALRNDHAQTTVLGHTRWASVGIISESNAHPLNHEELGDRDGPYVTAALNGDVDNYTDLIALQGLAIPAEITTDAKVIPALVSRQLRAGASVADAFRSTAVQLEGSVAIAANAVDAPDQLLLALRGSGQALYVGLAEDCFVVASEPYGVVEETARYVRMDGETPSNPENPAGSRGQVLVLDAAGAGTLEGIRRRSYDGTELAVTDTDVQVAQITTRDIDRADFPHFLLKEISESPVSFRKTLRGKVAEVDGRLRAELDDGVLPETVRKALRERRIRRVYVIGQGTAAVAGQCLASVLETLAPALTVEAIPATELSGFRVADDMSDMLVVAISQSGTTTDTNRTVDVVRERGASVLAIVNRRNSDLVDKSDGVLYTSDGRDVEMSVASTKAFYAQIAAGFLLACGIAQETDPGTGGDARHELLHALRTLPEAMSEVTHRRAHIAEVAQRTAPFRRYWAVVGNGPNNVAAREVRIKLSELCYKSIACDVTEDKKHIDLSSEPLIFVCAAGLTGSNTDDVAKEIAIYRAHKAAPVVVCDDGETRFQAALETITVPPVHPALAFVLAAMAGHLFGYEAALAIDASARPLREVRAAIEEVVSARTGGDDVMRTLGPALAVPTDRFFDGLRAGSYDGHLEASTAVRASSLLRYATGILPLESYQVEYGKVGTPSTVVEDLTTALTRAIEELTRPVDAIKHQAKTVTVGISRSDETLLRVPLVQEVLAAGAPRDRLSYRTLRTLVALDQAVEQVTGYTRYRVEGDVLADTATVHVVDRGGMAVGLPTRTDSDPRLRGTKHRAATEREVTVARGHDGRTVVIVPEAKGTQVTGISLLHVHLEDRLDAPAARAVLEGYRGRYAALKDAVTEFEPAFDDAVLARVGLVDLLTDPVYVLAEHWRPA
ncbi:MAG: SIS domain-containing protein [Acidimicrobiia bacterium]